MKFLEIFCGLALLSQAMVAAGAQSMPGADIWIPKKRHEEAPDCLPTEASDLLDPEVEK